MNKVAARLKDLGMYTFVRWNYIFAPPLCINKEQIEEGLAMISDASRLQMVMFNNISRKGAKNR